MARVLALGAVALGVSASPGGLRTGGDLPGASPLVPIAWKGLPAGSVLPTGWLKTELELQADGIGGHLQEFWEPMYNSVWLGGNSNFEDWSEIAPYVFDGFTALATLLNDTRPELGAQVDKWLTYVLEHASNDGWLGPTLNSNDDMLYWIRWPAMKAMLQWMEFSGDARMLPAVMKQQRAMAAQLPTAPLRYTWQGVRWQDWVQINEYLIDSGLLSADDTQFLYDLSWAVYNSSRATAVDWERNWFNDAYFQKGPVTNNFNLTNHGVNTGQALKSGAVYYRFSKDQLGVQSSYDRMRLLDTYHGVPSGVFQADEHLAGNMPSHGTETCTVAEAIYSYNIMHEYVGDAVFAERAEHILYNAMPAALTKNFTGRVYLQSSNEVAAVVQRNHVWYSDGDDAIIYSLVGNYACCTANFHQGWPKAVQHAIHAAPAGGYAVSILAPVTAALPGGGVLTVDTEYPFGDSVTMTYTGTTAATPLFVRIPSWATGATITVGGGAPVSVGSANGTMYAVGAVPAGTPVVLATNPVVRLSGPWYNGAIAVHRGALLYTLQLEQSIVTTHVWSNVSSDINVTIPANAAQPWNLALVTDPTDPDQSKYFTFAQSGPVPYPPFSSQDTPFTITAKARQVPSWGVVQGQPDAPPASPVNCATVKGGCGNEITVTLVPFGATHIRLTELPYVAPN